MSNKIQGLHFFLVAFATGAAIGTEKLLDKLRLIIVSPIFDVGLIVVGAAGLYSLLLKLAVDWLNTSDTLLKFYWGRHYMKGLWVYTSHDHLNNNYRGVYRFDQDAFGTTVVAFGIDAEYRKRTSVTSVAVTFSGSSWVIVSQRTDWEYTDKPAYSRTVATPDVPVKNGLFAYPMIIRGETQIFGGARDGLVTRNVTFRRREDVQTEDELLNKLRQEAAVDPDEPTPASSSAFEVS